MSDVFVRYILCGFLVFALSTDERLIGYKISYSKCFVKNNINVKMLSIKSIWFIWNVYDSYHNVMVIRQRIQFQSGLLRKRKGYRLLLCTYLFHHNLYCFVFAAWWSPRRNEVHDDKRFVMKFILRILLKQNLL